MLRINHFVTYFSISLFYVKMSLLSLWGSLFEGCAYLNRAFMGRGDAYWKEGAKSNHDGKSAVNLKFCLPDLHLFLQ